MNPKHSPLPVTSPAWRALLRAGYRYRRWGSRPGWYDKAGRYLGRECPLGEAVRAIGVGA